MLSDAEIIRDMRELTNFNPRSAYAERLEENGAIQEDFDFNPRSAYAERLIMLFANNILEKYFNPRSAYAERQYLCTYIGFIILFQSTLRVCRATEMEDYVKKESTISIHAPRMLSDDTCCTVFSTTPDFNPRSAYAERLMFLDYHLRYFQYFNPRSAYAERLDKQLQKTIALIFQSTLRVCRATVFCPKKKLHL